MKLLLLLLLIPLCALSFSENNEETRIKGKIDGLRKKFGRISKENKAKLAKSLGQDPEERKGRLRKLFSRKANRTLTEEQRQQLQERIAKIRPVKTEKPNENEPIDLFEVNEKKGVSEYLFQGDLLLTNAQLNELEHDLGDAADPIRAKRQATTVYSKWTGNTVYYYLDSSINQRKRNSVAAAIDYIESRTCLKFVYSTTATNRIKVFSGAGCYSSVGMIGGEQELSLDDGCEVIGTVAHEFAHALGIWHTQMRSDRDDYVTVDLSNVEAGSEGNFNKLSPSGNILYTPYEYGSFMHYTANAGTTQFDRLTIIPKDPRFAYTMGSRQISFFDIKMINEFYGCNATCPAATSAQCQNGGYPNPKNCATCNCPLGYELKCNKKPVGCGVVVTATASWQSKEITVGDSTDMTNTRDDFTFCTHWITAPAGMTVQTRITYMYNSQCQYGCPYNGIEIKTDANPQVTNPRFCCPEFNNQVFTSDLVPTPVIVYNRYYYTTFIIEYRSIPSNGPASTTKVPPPPTEAPPPTTKAPLPPTKAPPPTTKAPPPTTKAPVISRICVNRDGDATCATDNLYLNYCSLANSNSPYDFGSVKRSCAKTCGLCGRKANPCIDIDPHCAGFKAAGMCSSTYTHPMEAEYFCAKTCGFCDLPN